ncbi:hypothetical protein BQ8794_330014 [Mesorhizobium prunaredense]|uniref:Uncharacterized protein n=1 Tax=Mesorhizobium prunaredense TaxID=1631249 RepID=A0A1R3VBP0_9HYPH|nr:hypothetical protein BQ8794_330014 [Mesorhizobium prunaredense]
MRIVSRRGRAGFYEGEVADDSPGSWKSRMQFNSLRPTRCELATAAKGLRHRKQHDHRGSAQPGNCRPQSANLKLSVV